MDVSLAPTSDGVSRLKVIAMGEWHVVGVVNAGYGRHIIFASKCVVNVITVDPTASFQLSAASERSKLYLGAVRVLKSSAT